MTNGGTAVLHRPISNTATPTSPLAPESALFAAQWSQFEQAASQLMDEFDIARWERTSRVYLKWSEREAELGNSETAKRDHSISVACAQKAELIRRYPGEMTDTLAVLADIFDEKRAASWK